MGRFIVGESIVRAPYWPVSPNSFGGQIGASANGDAPGDIYRLIGGVVLRRAGQAPMYAGYIASAFLLPKGTNNNRVVAPGSEDLHRPDWATRRASSWSACGRARRTRSAARSGPAVQIDPLLPVVDPLRADVSRRAPADRRRHRRPVRIVRGPDRVAARRAGRLPLPADARPGTASRGRHAGPARQRRRVLRVFEDAARRRERASGSTARRSGRSRRPPG